MSPSWSSGSGAIEGGICMRPESPFEGLIQCVRALSGSPMWRPRKDEERVLTLQGHHCLCTG